MTVYKNQNFAFTEPPCENGDVFENCNLSQKVVTGMFVGKTGLTFIKCNRFNCNLPADSTIEGGLGIHKDCCSWLHPEWNLSEEAENCRHVVDTDTLTVDEQTIEINYIREDTVI